MKAVLLVLAAVAVCATAQLSVDFQVAQNAGPHQAVYRNGGATQQTKSLVVRLWQEFKVKASKGSFLPEYSYFAYDDLNGKKEALPLVAKLISPTEVSLTANFPFVGRYLLLVRKGAQNVFLSNTKMYFLFNPWNAKCETYVNPSKAGGQYGVDLKEYVLNEKGAVWRGSSNSNSPMPWSYGQFDLSVLDVTMNLLTELATKSRDAIRVARQLTVGGQTVLEGRWDGEYSDGAQPGSWVSSTDIINKFISTGKTVKYGQCWVFASLLTALGRTLGFPTMSLSNFDSAHEHKPFKQECHQRWVQSSGSLQFSARDSSCSIWNFHVWNHVWIAERKDIGANMGGWQAFDATPQESSSEGPNEAPFNQADYFTGPASLAALFKLDFKSKYDNAFIGGEINAKVFYYNCVSASKCTLTSTSTKAVGELALSKTPDSLAPNTAQNNAGYTRVYSTNWNRAYSPNANVFLETDAARNRSNGPEALFRSVLPKELTLGKPFSVGLKPYAPAIDAKKLRGVWGLSLYARPVNYMTGLPVAADIFTGTLKLDFDGRTSRAALLKGLEQTVGRDFWSNASTLAALEKTNYFQFVFSAVSAKGATPFFDERSTAVVRPALPVICGRKPEPERHVKEYKQGEVIHCVVKFFNPINKPLTNVKVKLTVTGQSIKEEAQQVAAQKQTVVQHTQAANATDVDESGATVKGMKTQRFGGFQFKLVGAAGKQEVIASIVSKEIRDMYGSNSIVIKEDAQVQKQESQAEQQTQQQQGINPSNDQGIQQDQGKQQGLVAKLLEKAKNLFSLRKNAKKPSAGKPK